ncbi:alpha/beta fold hydrolase [Nocardia sp. CA-120079]|uniref:alpha/beta fold hydrolase n=1 Tax=Nocardia sp. CA-120079 TaxID=3239974 RepID=UPI003D98DB98
MIGSTRPTSTDEFAEIELQVAGSAVSCLSMGTGPQALLLHGLNGRGSVLPLARELATRFRVVVPSHPGWDDEPTITGVDSATDLAERYAELCEQLDNLVGIVGCSFGAWIAMQMAATVTRNSASVVLVSPIGVKAGSRESRDYLDLFAVSHEEVMRAFYGGRDRWPDFSAWTDEEFLAMARAQESVARYGWQPYLHDPKLARRLRRIAAPTLVICGDADGVVLNRDVFGMVVEGIPRAQAATVGGAGHIVEQTHAGEVSKLIVGHLSGVGISRDRERA